jgi:hypothetical protein
MHVSPLWEYYAGHCQLSLVYLMYVSEAGPVSKMSNTQNISNIPWDSGQCQTQYPYNELTTVTNI